VEHLRTGYVHQLAGLLGAVPITVKSSVTKAIEVVAL
jgi:hypothetical protein